MLFWFFELFRIAGITPFLSRVGTTAVATVKFKDSAASAEHLRWVNAAAVLKGVMDESGVMGE